MRRVTVADIMRETGLSRATVDRVLNGRAKVHDRTRAVVEETMARLRSGAICHRGRWSPTLRFAWGAA